LGGYPKIDPNTGEEIAIVCPFLCEGKKNVDVFECEETESQEIGQCQQTESETIVQCEIDGFNEFTACNSDSTCEQEAIDKETACIDQANMDGSSCVDTAEQNGSMCVDQAIQEGMQCVQACPALFQRAPSPNIHPSLTPPNIQIDGRAVCDFNKYQPRDSCTVLDPTFGSQTFNFFVSTDDFVTELLIFSGSVEDGSLIRNSLSVDPLNPVDFDIIITNSALFDILQNPVQFFSFVEQDKVFVQVNNPGLSEETALSGFNDLLFCQDLKKIGGKIIPIEQTSLILAGTQSFSWMIPVVLSGIGIGLFVVSRKSE